MKNFPVLGTIYLSLQEMGGAMSMRLKELRESRNVTQKRAAEAAGIESVHTYRKYENGERGVPTEVLIALADFYDVSLDYLMGRDVTTDQAEQIQLEALLNMLDSDGRKLLITIAKVIVKSGDYLSI